MFSPDFIIVSIYVFFSAAFIITVTDRKQSLVKSIALGLTLSLIFLGLYYLSLVYLPMELTQLYLRSVGVFAGICFSAYISKHVGAISIFPFLV